MGPNTPKLFPHLMSKQLDFFSFLECSFAMPKSKESTSRITMFHLLKIPFVFTLEASFAGANKGRLTNEHFSINDLESIGKAVLKTIYQLKLAEGNKRLMRELNLEVDQYNTAGEECDDSDGSSEEEDETEMKKVI